MKLTVIGYWGGYPGPNRATSCYLLEKGDFSLVIDAGSGALSRLQNIKDITEIDAVILSHYHQDHVADIGVWQYALLIQSYLSNDKTILPIYGHVEDKQGFESLTHDYTEGIAYDPKNTLQVGPFAITFLKTKHPVPCYGMRISDGKKTIVYTADTSYQEEWVSFSKGADLLITDCNFYTEQDGSQAGHMTSQEGAIIAEKAGVGELILSHLPHYGDHNDLLREAREIYKGKIQLAEEGLIWGDM